MNFFEKILDVLTAENQQLRSNGDLHAGLKSVGESVAKLLEYYHNNMTGTFILLDVPLQEHHLLQLSHRLR